MQERSAYEVFHNIKLVRIFSSVAYLREVEIGKSTITLKYATDAERISAKMAPLPPINWHSFDFYLVIKLHRK